MNDYEYLVHGVDILATNMETDAPRDIQTHTRAPIQRQTETQTDTDADRITQRQPETQYTR